jgi:hypothetical protein
VDKSHRTVGGGGRIPSMHRWFGALAGNRRKDSGHPARGARLLSVGIPAGRPKLLGRVCLQTGDIRGRAPEGRPCVLDLTLARDESCTPVLMSCDLMKVRLNINGNTKFDPARVRTVYPHLLHGAMEDKT